MLHEIYRKLPIPHYARRFISSRVPHKYKREAHLRSFGVINDLYLWRTDFGIDTIAPIQNFFSALFPELDTNTICNVWFYDATGTLINQHQFKLAAFGFYKLRLSDYVPSNANGSFMWHIQMPESIATRAEIQNGNVYFTDRGYICFEKDSCQPAFMHGIDRYSVFQKTELLNFTEFYKSSSNREWLAEFPLTANMQTSTDIVLINRASKSQKYRLNVFENGGVPIFSREQTIEPRGVGIFKLNNEDLINLKSEHAYFSVQGITTPWGRPAIMRHFKTGAISMMHC